MAGQRSALDTAGGISTTRETRRRRMGRDRVCGQIPATRRICGEIRCGSSEQHSRSAFLPRRLHGIHRESLRAAAKDFCGQRHPALSRTRYALGRTGASIASPGRCTGSRIRAAAPRSGLAKAARSCSRKRFPQPPAIAPPPFDCRCRVCSHRRSGSAGTRGAGSQEKR